MTPGSQSRRAWWLIAGAVLLAVVALAAGVFVGERLGNRTTAAGGLRADFARLESRLRASRSAPPAVARP
ncbi:hypothetical protein, partial [Mycobacterium sp.]|uniref:hypothetical protein n=1 Tax=Mycobacterium sp. TaxID=1785 RepID=UPI003C791399